MNKIKNAVRRMGWVDLALAVPAIGVLLFNLVK